MDDENDELVKVCTYQSYPTENWASMAGEIILAAVFMQFSASYFLFKKINNIVSNYFISSKNQSTFIENFTD